MDVLTVCFVASAILVLMGHGYVDDSTGVSWQGNSLHHLPLATENHSQILTNECESRTHTLHIGSEESWFTGRKARAFMNILEKQQYHRRR